MEGKYTQTMILWFIEHVMVKFCDNTKFSTCLTECWAFKFKKKYKSGPKDSLTEVKAKDSNDTPARDEDAHKAVLCTHSNFLWGILVIQMLKKIVSKILCYSLLLFWRKWSCRGCKKRFQWYSCMRWQCSKIYSLFSHKLLLDIITKYICASGKGPGFRQGWPTLFILGLPGPLGQGLIPSAMAAVCFFRRKHHTNFVINTLVIMIILKHFGVVGPISAICIFEFKP